MSGYVKQRFSDLADGGYRDWHRTLGSDLPATDVDFVEYDARRPVALFEIKHQNVGGVRRDDANIETLIRLAEPRNSELPLFICFHDDDLSDFLVRGVNRAGVQRLGASSRVPMSESVYINFLRGLRK